MRPAASIAARTSAAVAAIVVVGVAAASCDSGKPTGARARAGSGSASGEVTGSLIIGGAPVVVTACRPRTGAHTHVILESARGALRFEDRKLYWNADDPTGFQRGAELTCARLDRSWGGGSRTDGSAYFRGRLSFDCRSGELPFDGELELDCGDITAEERAQLDAQRVRLQGEQRGSAVAP